ncbi:hypothetical protein C0992_011767 [Termitomyces sp. T32_za158]|nr:hypothetical protein C0992_011767 [Termitomyces sp. T32_za158]
MPTTPTRKSSIGTARRGPQKAHIPYRGDNPEVGKKTGIAVRHVERKSDGFEPFDELIEQADKRTPPQLNVAKKRKQSIAAPGVDSDGYGEMSMDIESPANRNGSSSRAVARTSDIDFDHIPSPRSSRKSAGSRSSRLSISYVAPADRSDGNDNVPDYGYGGDYDDQPDSSGEQDAPQGASFREMDEDDDDDEQDPPDEEPEETPPPYNHDKGKGRAALSDVPEEHESDIEDEIAQSLEDIRQTYSDDEEPPPAEELEPSPPRAKKIKIAEKSSETTRQRNGRTKKENRIYREGVRKSAREHYKPLEWWRGEKLVYGRPQGSGNGHVLVPPIKEIIRIPKETPEPLGKRKRTTRGRSKTADDLHYKVIPVYNPENGWDDKTQDFSIILDYHTREEVERRVACVAKDVPKKMIENNDWKFMKAFGDDDFIAAGILEIPPRKKKPTKQTKDNTYVRYFHDSVSSLNPVTQIFYIIEGAANVRIHNSNFMLATGAMFIVPRGMPRPTIPSLSLIPVSIGNSYYIENVCERSVKLFFTQARKLIEDIPPIFAPPRRLSIGATAPHGRSSSVGGVQGEKRALSGAPAHKRATSTR